MGRATRRIRAGLVTVLLLGGCARAPSQLVVFAVMDAARGDRVSYAGYARETTPFLDTLASGRSLIAYKHFSQGAATRSAMPRMFYSRYFVPPLFPGSSKIPIEGPRGLFSRLDDHALSVPSAFADTGFRTLAVSAHSWLRPGTELVSLFDEFHDLSPQQSNAYPEAPQVVDRALEVLADRSTRRTFLYLHFMDTHWPYRFDTQAQAFYGDQPDLAGAFDSQTVLQAEQPMSDLEKRYYNALYDGSLRRIDDQLSRLMESVAALEVWDEVSVVVTSDHGEHLGEVRGRSTHGGRWFDAVAHIPLLIFAPHDLDERVVLELPTESVDLLPTLAELFQLRVREHVEFDGQSLVSGTTDGIAMAPDAIRLEVEKVIGVDPEIPLWSQAAPPEYYRLDLDHLEMDDRSLDNPDRVKKLVAQHRQLLSYSFHRFRNAKNQAPPPLPFAIASKDFSFLPGSGIENRLLGWLHSQDQGSYNLTCVKPPCGEVDFSFPMPNGEYVLTVSHHGVGEIKVAGGEHEDFVVIGSRRATTTSDHLLQPWSSDLETFTYGVVTVSGKEFAAGLRAVDGPGLSIRYLGFIPQGTQVNRDQDSYEARLKALGYLQ